MVSHLGVVVSGRCVMVVMALARAWTALGMARWGRAWAFLRCRDLGMVPRGPLVDVGFAGARVRWD